MPGFAASEIGLLHALARRGGQTLLLERMLATGVRLSSASRGPVDLLRADRFASERSGIEGVLAALVAAQSLVAEATSGIDRARDALDELAALLSSPPPAGVDIDAEVDRLLDEYGGAIRAAGSMLGERTIGGARAIRFSGRDEVLAGPIRFLRAPRDPISFTVDIESLGGAPSLWFGVPGGGAGQSSEFVIEGPLGAATISVASTDAATIGAAIQAVSLVTGVGAVIIGGALQLDAPFTGSASIITFTPKSGAGLSLFPPEGLAAAGSDAIATCAGGYVEAAGNRMRVVHAGALVEIDARAPGLLRLDVEGGGLLVPRSTALAASIDARLGIPSLEEDEVGFDSIGTLTELRSGGALAPSGGQLLDARIVVEGARRVLERCRGAIADFDAKIIERDRLALDALVETVAAAESDLRLADLPKVALDLDRARGAEARSQAALEALFAHWARLLTILPSGFAPNS